MNSYGRKSNGGGDMQLPEETLVESAEIGYTFHRNPIGKDKGWEPPSIYWMNAC